MRREQRDQIDVAPAVGQRDGPVGVDAAQRGPLAENPLGDR
jgi:hypothetical protein